MNIRTFYSISQEYNIVNKWGIKLLQDIRACKKYYTNDSLVILYERYNLWNMKSPLIAAIILQICSFICLTLLAQGQDG